MDTQELPEPVGNFILESNAKPVNGPDGNYYHYADVCRLLNEYKKKAITDAFRSKEYILCAAIWYKEIPLKRPDLLEPRGFRPYNIASGVVISGWRHGNCIYQVGAITGLRSVLPEVGESIQGFLTSKNRFVTREEAAEIALAAGQIEKPTTTLFSEDIY